MTTEETKLCQIRIAQALAPFFIPGGTGHDSTALDRAVIAVMDAIGSPSPSQPAVLQGEPTEDTTYKLAGEIGYEVAPFDFLFRGKELHQFAAALCEKQAKVTP